MKNTVSIILVLSMLVCLFGFSSCNTDNAADQPIDTSENTSTDAPTDLTDAPTDSTDKPTEATDKPSGEPEADKKYRVLFIGNSFTFYNNMPMTFAQICKAAGINVEVKSITNGGHKLEEFADVNDEYGDKVYDELNRGEKYDYVILQEQSGRPISNPASFYDGARDLATLVNANGAELWFYQTWGYKEGYSKLPTHGGTTEIMELKLRAAYDAIASEVGAGVAHVGIAMYDLHSNDEFTPNLYNSDLYHPSEYGSALAAWTIFASIFEIDPMTVDFDGGIDKKELEMIKDAAYYAAFAPQPVPDDYKVKSEGVTKK